MKPLRLHLYVLKLTAIWRFYYKFRCAIEMPHQKKKKQKCHWNLFGDTLIQLHYNANVNALTRETVRSYTLYVILYVSLNQGCSNYRSVRMCWQTPQYPAKYTGANRNTYNGWLPLGLMSHQYESIWRDCFHTWRPCSDNNVLEVYNTK
jgi:hypothetical protein